MEDWLSQTPDLKLIQVQDLKTAVHKILLNLIWLNLSYFAMKNGKKYQSFICLIFYICSRNCSESWFCTEKHIFQILFGSHSCALLCAVLCNDTVKLEPLVVLHRLIGASSLLWMELLLIPTTTQTAPPTIWATPMAAKVRPIH